MPRTQSSKLNQDESENLNRLIIFSEMKTVITKLPENKSPRSKGITRKFYQTLEVELTLRLLKLL